MWQTLERKARFISQVMHARLDARDITDIGDTALSFSEVKALATGKPLLIDKAEADAELTRLERAERAHHRGQQSLRYAVTRHEQDIAALTLHASEIDTAISRRQDIRGDKFTMTVDGQQHARRSDAGQHLTQVLQREAAEFGSWRERTIHLGHLGGFPMTAAIQQTREGKTGATITLDGAPGATIDLTPSDLRGSDHGTVITRLENRLTASKPARPATWPTSSTPSARSPTPRTHSASRSPRQPSSPPPGTGSARSTTSSNEWPRSSRPTPAAQNQPRHRTTRTAESPRSQEPPTGHNRQATRERTTRQATQLRASTAAIPEAAQATRAIARRLAPGTSRQVPAQPKNPRTGETGSRPPNGNSGCPRCPALQTLPPRDSRQNATHPRSAG